MLASLVCAVFGHRWNRPVLVKITAWHRWAAIPPRTCLRCDHLDFYG